MSVIGQCSVRGIIDLGSMSCTLSEEANSKLIPAGVDLIAQHVPENVVLVCCGGLLTQPKCIYELDIEIYGSSLVVPTFLVLWAKRWFHCGNEQCDPAQKIKVDTKYWEPGNTRVTV